MMHTQVRREGVKGVIVKVAGEVESSRVMETRGVERDDLLSQQNIRADGGQRFAP